MSASPVSAAGGRHAVCVQPQRAVVVAAVLGSCRRLLATALIIYVVVVWLLGIDLSFEQFIGATLLGTYLSG
jgi:hypothetical protein